jgi:predicted nucleic acid-binding OB-fold protein
VGTCRNSYALVVVWINTQENQLKEETVRVKIIVYTIKGNEMRTLDLDIKQYKDVQALERVAWAMAVLKEGDDKR